MKTSLIYPVLILLSATTYGQQPVIERVSSQVCDSLSHSGTPPEELTNEDLLNILRPIIALNSQDWIMKLDEYKMLSGKTEYDFDQYFQHILKMHCPEYRKIERYLDAYLVEEKNLLPLYVKTKEFIYGLVDGADNEQLSMFFDNGVRNEELDSLLYTCKYEIDRCKRHSTLSIMLVYVDGYTFRARYFDYITNEPEFQIDLIFKNDTDSQIDYLSIKKKKTLLIEQKEQNELFEKVERGEIELPPPPAFKKKQ